METLQQIIARLVLLADGSWELLMSKLKVAEWTFAPGGGGLLFAGWVFAAILVVVCYYRTKEGLTMGSRVGLAALRFVSIVALLVIASGACVALDIAAPQQPKMLVLLDDSPSMGLPDGGGTRLTYAQNTLYNNGLLERLKTNYDVKIQHTSSAATASTEASENPQQLAKTIIEQSARPSDAPLSQILLVSDGVQLGTVALANAAAELPAPLNTLSVADDAKISDVILESVNVPPYVFQNDRALITGQLRSVGMETEVSVQLVQATDAVEQQVATTKVALKENEQRSVRLEFAAPKAGLHRYFIRMQPVKGELTDRNNSIHFHLDVRDEKIRVLFVEGEPSWEYKFVKQAMEKDNVVVEFYGLVRLPGEEWFYQGHPKRPDGKPVIRNSKNGFPEAADELNFFDVLIVGDLDRKVFERAGGFDLVENFVKNRGGGLATIGGFKVYADGNYQDTPLARMLPIDINKKEKPLVNRFQVRATTQGIMHPAMQLEFDPVKNEEAWAALPWVEGGNAFRTVKPGATMLLAHPKLKTASGARPIAAAWQCGAGRIVTSALDGTWHWRTARKSDTDYHQRYWGQVVRWLAGDPRMNKTIGSLICDDPVLEVAKPATFSVNLRDKDGNALVDATTEFHIETPAGEKLVGRTSSDPSVPGRYALTFTPKQLGTHKVIASVVRTGEQPVNQERSYYVAASRAEFLQVKPDGTALAELAKASGGTSGSLSQHTALQLPTPANTVKVRRVVLDVWQSPGLVMLLVGCLCMEWLLRKRRGLA